MSYDKTIWKSKDIITREKMQKIEDQLEIVSEQGLSALNATAGQVPTADGNGSWAWSNATGGGGSGGALIINVVYGDNLHLDKTAGEIAAAVESGKMVYVKEDTTYNDPEYGYVTYRYCPLGLYIYYNPTGTKEESNARWEFTIPNLGIYAAYNLTDYPVIQD